ncbi:MAG TPA: CIA30 family protein [Longimicrobium sp.]|jgi:hypothetical protein
MARQTTIAATLLLCAACVRPAAPHGAVAGWIARFDGGPLRAESGAGWEISTDSRAGGRSTAQMGLAEGGAEGTGGALAVSGTVDPGLPYAWAGASYSPGPARYAPADLSTRTELVFWARGDGRTYRVMMLSGAPDGREIRSEQRFATSPEWSLVRIPLAGMRGANLAEVRAITFAAGPEPGAFSFAIDQLQLR